MSARFLATLSAVASLLAASVGGYADATDSVLAGSVAAEAPGLSPVALEVPLAFQVLTPFEQPRQVNLPAGFRIAVFAAGLGSPRQIAFNRAGVLFSANLWQGEIVAHPDQNGDGYSDASERVVFQSDLWAPHSLAFDGADLYVGTHNQVLRLTDADGDLTPDSPPASVVDLPTFGDQITRTVLIGPDRRLYVGIGSTTNAGLETDPRRGAVVRYERDGSAEAIFASGLRNPVGLVVHPGSGAIWATDVGVDHLGEDHPFEEINILQSGEHYGWPLCYEDRRPDLQLYPIESPAFCPATTPPVATLPAHTTPLGLTFYTGNTFPPDYRDRLFIALHGSSKRLRQAGYEVVTLKIGEQGENPVVEPFAAGWLLDPERAPDQPGQNWGRPVHPAVGPDGALYLSSDAHGAIYRIWYEP